ncbi:PTS sugar transporter subunit IIA [Thermoanaerobacterium sp. DL9XJH110]|uniref:PTS sugar transporter subunit IIA n=1 Tax=Thermoanaerobacterium sp. DL9XJH110 TaxID=3386643 RepID=UPI003BB6EAB6
MLINKNLIFIDLEAEDKEEAISKLARAAAREGKITSLEDFKKSVLERERSYTTGVGNGIAIPHGKSKAVKEAMIVFGRTAKGIDWDSLDGKPVNIIFLLGVPEENVSDLHLKLLQQLSRKLMNIDFVMRLQTAETREEVFDALKDIKIS